MKTSVEQLVSLGDTMARHLGVTHWAVSRRLTGKGDFFGRLKDGKDIQTGTFDRMLAALSEAWPADLEWPADIPRPEPQAKDPAA